MIRSWFARHLFFPTQEALQGRDSMRYWRELEQSQWFTPEQLRDLQDRKLRRLIRHAVSQTPFYRRRFSSAGVDDGEFKSIEQLGLLPLLTKDDIRKSRDQMLAQTLRGDVIRSCTSGSTGSPLIFSVGPQRCRSDVSARLRAHRWFDVAPGDPAIYLWGSRIEIDRQDRLKAIRDWLINERLLNAFELSDERLQYYADIFLRTRPHSVYSYASSLWRFAQYVHQHRPELKGAIRKVAFATGERLLAHWREQIIDSLGCPVAEEYGCREGGLIAHECPAGAFHIMAENIIVEVLDDHGAALLPGEEGNIVLTNLEALAMPFIRYVTGDRGALRRGRCDCGRTLPMMWRPTGRTFEFLETQDGTRITGVSLSRDLKEVEGIAHYRVIQEARHRVRVLLVVDGRYRREEGEALIYGFVRARIGDTTDVVIRYLEHLPSHPSGKYRYVVNAIPTAGGRESWADR